MVFRRSVATSGRISRASRPATTAARKFWTASLVLIGTGAVTFAVADLGWRGVAVGPSAVLLSGDGPEEAVTGGGAAAGGAVTARRAGGHARPARPAAATVPARSRPMVIASGAALPSAPAPPRWSPRLSEPHCSALGRLDGRRNRDDPGGGSRPGPAQLVEIASHVGGRRPVRRPCGQTTPDDRRVPGRHTRRQLSGLVDPGVRQFRPGVHRVRRLPGDELVQQRAECVHVSRRQRRQAVKAFGRDVRGSAERGAAAVLVGLSDRCADAEIDYLDHGIGEHDVAGRDVAVHDAPLVRGGESVRDLRPDGGGFGPTQRSPLQADGQCLAFEQFHDDERCDRAVRPQRFGVVMHGGNVGMGQLGRGACLAADEIEEFDVSGGLAGQQFHRHVPAEEFVVRTPYGRHATLFDRGDEAVAQGQSSSDRRPVVGHPGRLVRWPCCVNPPQP